MEAIGKTLSMVWILPFALLLLSIALMPLVLPHWWKKNSSKGIVGIILSLPVAILFFGLDYHHLIHTGVEYFSFIVLLLSLYVISGGIVLRGDIKATPFVNSVFLAQGAVFANVIGTTGASMLLIRPLLRINSERRQTVHIPIFFIFLVSNIGGLLTPLGDPPLFLGYLRGVPFTWTFKLLPIWIVAVGMVLLVFYVFDYLAVKKELPEDIVYDSTNVEPLQLLGKINLLFLGGVVIAIIFAGFLEQRGINPSPWRELVMLAMTFLSYTCTQKSLHEENKFSFGPIIEVAVLFAGIFVTMVPALLILRERGGEFGITRPWQFFWMSGGLSSFLDNAPTYLTHLSLGQGVTETLKAQGAVLTTVAAQGGNIAETLLMAVSAGSVCMGANSYIGNGPNFMVKSIAEDTGLKMPGFFGYMVYSCLILIPVFILITFIFFNPFTK